MAPLLTISLVTVIFFLVPYPKHHYRQSLLFAHKTKTTTDSKDTIDRRMTSSPDDCDIKINIGTSFHSGSGQCSKSNNTYYQCNSLNSLARFNITFQDRSCIFIHEDQTYDPFGNVITFIGLTDLKIMSYHPNSSDITSISRMNDFSQGIE